MATLEVSARELRQDPRRYDGAIVRFRDVVQHQLEAMTAAGAWWSPIGGDVGPGLHLAEVEGRWSSRGGHGPHGRWASEIAGTATLVPFDAPTPVDERDLPTCQELVPLATSGTARAMMQGLFWQGLEVGRLGRDARMPMVARPQAQTIRAVFCRLDDRLHVASFELLGTQPLEPRRVEPHALASARTGEYVLVEGELAAGAASREAPRAGLPSIVRWPRLEGALDVVLPSIATTPFRHTLPTDGTAGMAEWRSHLAHGPRRVRAIGEVRVVAGGTSQLWATELALL